jgi:threonylcarbamoyladenosine tRNA methylthiotransferase MtaB
VLREAEKLLESGYKELVLCGIRLGGYRWEGMKLDGLLNAVLKAHRGRFRIRLSSLNPAEVTRPLMEVMAEDSRVARHLHLPLQSGDREVLKSMGRPYTPHYYLKKIEEVRRHLSDPAISTDLMVGFPGEGDAAFQASLDTLEEARVSRIHVFPFSARKGTEAAARPPPPEHVKKARVRRGLKLASKLKERFDRSFLGRRVSVLVETLHHSATGLPAGLTSRYQKAVLHHRDTPVQRGRFVTILLKAYEKGLFTGRIVEEASDATRERSA